MLTIFIWQTQSNPCALTDRFHGNGPTRVFLFWSEAGKFKICNQKSEKKNLWILSFFTVKLPQEARKIEIFPKFQRWMKKTNILHASFIIVHPIFPSTALALG